MSNLFFICSIGLMSEIVKSQELFVMQIEVDVYNLLKVWAFVHLHPDYIGSWKDARAQTNAYFSERKSDVCFLESDEGRAFVPAFRSIRLHHVINDLRSVQLLDSDKIIPQGTYTHKASDFIVKVRLKTIYSVLSLISHSRSFNEIPCWMSLLANCLQIQFT